MPEQKHVAIFDPKTHVTYLCKEVTPHPADARFTGYQNGSQWLSVDPAGNVSLSGAPSSYEAFKAADNATYLLADRSAFGGGCYRLAYVTYTPPAGPSA